MKRNKCRRGRHLFGFQPLHFTWQPWQSSAHFSRGPTARLGNNRSPGGRPRGIIGAAKPETSMRLLACVVGLALVLPAAVAAPARPAANLLVNGSFEDGPEDIGDFKSLDKGSDEIKGWKVT